MVRAAVVADVAAADREDERSDKKLAQEVEAQGVVYTVVDLVDIEIVAEVYLDIEKVAEVHLDIEKVAEVDLVIGRIFHLDVQNKPC